MRAIVEGVGIPAQALYLVDPRGFPAPPKGSSTREWLAWYEARHRATVWRGYTDHDARGTERLERARAVVGARGNLYWPGKLVGRTQALAFIGEISGARERAKAAKTLPPRRRWLLLEDDAG